MAATLFKIGLTILTAGFLNSKLINPWQGGRKEGARMRSWSPVRSLRAILGAVTLVAGLAPPGEAQTAGPPAADPAAVFRDRSSRPPG